MTLLDLWNLIKKSWWLAVALPVACALVCWAAAGAIPSQYSATATLVTSGQLNVMSGQASGAAKQQSAETGYDILTKVDTYDMTVTVTAKGSSAEDCVRIANETAALARTSTLELLGQESTAGEVIEEAGVADSVEPGNIEDAALYALTILAGDEEIGISITEATTATKVSASTGKYIAVAFIAGLLAAICIIVIRDMIRGSIHNAYEVEERYDLRQLGRVRKASSKRRSGAAAEDASLLAALDFASEGKPAMCLVPMEDAASAKRIVAELEPVAEAAGKRLACVGENANLTLSDPATLANAIASQAPADADLVFVLAPAVAESADFAYLAPACGCAALVLEAMRTKRTHLEDALRQLALSKTEVAGFIMVNAG